MKVRIIECQMCWKQMEVHTGLKKYCNECRQKKDKEFRDSKYKEEKHKYYIKYKEKIIQQNSDNQKKTVKELYQEIDTLYVRINNLRIILESKDKYIQELKDIINNQKKPFIN